MTGGQPSIVRDELRMSGTQREHLTQSTPTSSVTTCCGSPYWLQRCRSLVEPILGVIDPTPVDSGMRRQQA